MIPYPLTMGGLGRIRRAGLPPLGDQLVLLHGDGVDGSTTITDNGLAGRTWTANGNAQIDTAQSVFGGASINISSPSATTANSISTPDAADLSPGAQNFTIDLRCRWSATNLTNFAPTFIAKRNIASNFEYQFVYLNGQLAFYYSTNGTATSTIAVNWTPSLNTWYHIEVVRYGSNFYFFVDGVQVGATQTITGTIFSGTSAMYVFTDGTNATKFEGWIDELSFIIGARHISNFTPPAAPY